VIGQGFVFSSPLIHEGRIYVGAKDHHLYCVDLQGGEVLWSYDAGKEIYASPKGDGRGIVFSTADGQVICLDPKSGERRWQFRADREIGAAAAVWGRQLLIPGRDRTMYRIDYESGSIIEEIGLPGATHCTPCIGMGYAFLIVGGRKSAAIDLFESRIAWEGVATGDHKTPCAYFDKRVYLPLGKYVYCVNGATGEKLWEAEAQNRVTPPLINAGELIFAGKDGTLRVHDRKSGEEVVTVALGEQFIAGPILVGGTFYLAGSKSYLYAVE
jgi:outer membrane protein assembly factor BamB